MQMKIVNNLQEARFSTDKWILEDSFQYSPGLIKSFWLTGVNNIHQTVYIGKVVLPDVTYPCTAADVIESDEVVSDVDLFASETDVRNCVI